tara:strand:- start:2497 stop:2697 length:201 start_codon:yes stop_codon:yes gene_type:complete
MISLPNPTKILSMTTTRTDVKNYFSDEEWDMIVWSLEQEAVLLDEETCERYGRLVDKINELLMYHE